MRTMDGYVSRAARIKSREVNAPGSLDFPFLSAMSVFANKPFSRLWNGKSKPDIYPRTADFAGDAAPPFTELAESGLGRVPASEELARILCYNSKITFKDSEFVDLDLTHERRRLICAGRLFRTDSTFERKGMYELFVLLFDNYLVITNIVGTGPNLTFQVCKRPIPLDLLRVETYAPPSRKRTISGRNGTNTFPPESWDIAPPSGDFREMLPLVIYHDGRLGGTTRLYAETEGVQSTWKSKLDEAILFRQKSSQVFEVSVVAREEFLTMGTSRGLHTYPPGDRPMGGSITCAIPFSTHDGRTLLAIGCVEGLWIGIGKDLRSFRWVLRLPVQQCIVNGEYGLILIRSNGELHVFDLEESVPKSTGRALTFRPKILEIKGKVDFFRAGKLNGEMYIVAAVKKHLDTIFHVWEAAMTMGPDGPLPDPQKFRLVHTFFLPAECTEIVFLRTKLCVLHNNGFNLIKLPEMSVAGIPQVGDKNVSECKKVLKRCSSARPISMTRIEPEVFFLCYDKFGLYVDRYGVPLQGREIVEWEGQACHASFRFPYLLLFSPAFVEIRNLVHGRLIQIIRADVAVGNLGGSGCGGGPIRCLWDGRGGGRNANYDPEFGYVGGGDYGSGSGDGVHGDVDGPELPTVLGAVDIPIPTTTDEWGAQSSSSSVVMQQCVFTLFSPVPPPYSPHVEEPTVPYDADSII